MGLIDVSVIIPTYHREKILLEAIDSILRQRDVTFEIIVVDDSEEGSARAAVATRADSRLQYIQRKIPSGGRPAHVRNEGAQLARGRYLHFLDDDDVLEPDALARLSRALDAAPAAGMAFGVIEPFGADAAELKQQQRYFMDARRIARRLKGPDELSASLLFQPAILVNSACMARRTRFIAVGGFDTDILVCEDADFWARMAEHGGYVFVDHTVLRYRTGAPSLMHSLAAHDDRLRLSYERIHGKYRQTHGLMKFLAMKLWARAVLR